VEKKTRERLPARPNRGGMLRIKVDRIILTTSIFIFFFPDVEQSGYYTDAVTGADFFGYGAESDRCRSGCRLM
jgi:hypothetical protein